MRVIQDVGVREGLLAMHAICDWVNRRVALVGDGVADGRSNRAGFSVWRTSCWTTTSARGRLSVAGHGAGRSRAEA